MKASLELAGHVAIKYRLLYLLKAGADYQGKCYQKAGLHQDKMFGGLSWHQAQAEGHLSNLNEAINNWLKQTVILQKQLLKCLII